MSESAESLGGMDQEDQDPEQQAQGDQVEPRVQRPVGRSDEEAQGCEQVEHEVDDIHEHTVPGIVDGFTVEHAEETVMLTLTDRYGDGECYEMDPVSASRIGHALIAHATQCLERMP